MVFKTLGEDGDMEWVRIDSTIVRADQHAADAKKRGPKPSMRGRSCSGFSTKIHAAGDALGTPTF
jgi:hypothetical protein